MNGEQWEEKPESVAFRVNDQQCGVDIDSVGLHFTVRQTPRRSSSNVGIIFQVQEIVALVEVNYCGLDRHRLVASPASSGG